MTRALILAVITHWAVCGVMRFMSADDGIRLSRLATMSTTGRADLYMFYGIIRPRVLFATLLHKYGLDDGHLCVCQ